MWCWLCQIMPTRLTEEQKWKIIVLHKQNNLSLRKIATSVECSVHAVVQTISNYKDAGTVHERDRSGRPTLLDKHLLKSLDRIITKHDTAPSHELQHKLFEKTGRRVSPRTIRRARRGPLERHPVHDKAVHSLTQVHIAKRLSMSRFLLTTNIHNIWWSDEWYVSLTRTGQVHWIKKGVRAVPAQQRTFATSRPA